MNRDELWAAYRELQEAFAIHELGPCPPCKDRWAICDTRHALSAACTSARNAWQAAAPESGEVTLWRVFDDNASWGEPQEALILATSAQDAERWFLAEYERAAWQAPHSLTATPAALPTTGGILLTSYVSG